MNPSPEQIKDLRKRKHITQEQLADSLYDIKRERIGDWESGRRRMPGIIWWIIKWMYDKVDLREGE